MTFANAERAVNAFQARLVHEIVDHIDAWSSGSISTKRLLANTSGLIDAAGLRGKDESGPFYVRWARIDAEHELQTQGWAPTGSGSPERLAKAVEELRNWAVGVTASPEIGPETSGPMESRGPIFGSEASPDEAALIDAIAALDLELGHLLGEHLQEYEILLSTLFLADVVRWANRRFLEGDKDMVAALLTLLEDRYTRGDMHVRNLIGTGFVESMDQSFEPAGGVRSLLGPELDAQYRVTFGNAD